MTEGSISGKMIRFAVPVFIGNLFQQLYNTADALIVGNFVGNDALAAVSATGNLVFLLISFFGGVSMGAGVVTSRYFGARDEKKMRLSIHTTVAFNLVVGLVLTAAGTTLTPWLLRLMGTPGDVMDLSVTYIRVFFAGSMGLVMYNSLCGIMRAVGDSRSPLVYLIISSALNVVLDLLFVAVFSLGVTGAALATILAQFISAILCAVKLLRTHDSHRIVIREIGFDREMTVLIVRYGLPTGLQNSVIAIANVVVQSNINAFGTMAVSGCGAYSKIEGFAFLPITSFQMALTTFVGQNLGASEYDRAKKGARFGILCSIAAAELIGVAIYLSRALSARCLHQGARGHRLRRQKGADLLGLLFPAGGLALSLGGAARRGQGLDPDAGDADFLVRGARGVHRRRDAVFPLDRRGQLGLSADLAAQHDLSDRLLCPRRLAPQL